MSVAIVVQARMTSERLPGKVMKKVLEKPLLEFLLERLLRFQGVDLIVATTENEADQQIVDQCELMGVKCVRGSKNDVLTRYLQASEGYDIVVRVTG
ncbi:MAG: 3-deoxy-manno-octulosonate cytidylyltransferase, partial [Chlamydiae bacterium]|nr:3-deoxy-manno-octulosonate cytidylyltransferase [Chlamydiota bacterium]